MSDIISISNLPLPCTRVLQALDNAGIQTVELLTLDVFEIQRRTQLSVIDVQKLVVDVINALGATVDAGVKTAEERMCEFSFLTTGDARVDGLLGGGIPTGCLTEVSGESGLGKSQLCLQLCVHVQLPRSLGGLGAGAIYISTESSLVTTRLSQIVQSLSSTLKTPHPDIPDEDIAAALETLGSHGDQIYYYNCNDLETQEHIVTYQLPVLLARYSIGLIILDSVTANYRAEFDRTTSQKPLSQPAQMAQRSKDLRKLAGKLKDLAIEWNVAVVTANQVADSFKRSSSQSTTQPSQQDEELLSLDYQAQWFDGLVDEKGEASKKPALGLVWTNLITSRIMLVRDNPVHTRIKVVFSPFARPASLRYAISTEAGIHAVEDYVPTEEFIADFSDLDEEELLSGHP